MSPGRNTSGRSSATSKKPCAVHGGGWGLAGHANTNEELIAAARAQIAELKAKKPND
jgi:hypothetical protein